MYSNSYHQILFYQILYHQISFDLILFFLRVFTQKFSELLFFYAYSRKLIFPMMKHLPYLYPSFVSLSFNTEILYIVYHGNDDVD